MSLLVEEIPYSQATRSIREIVLDISPVQAFKVSGQGFVFKKDDTEVVIDTTTYTFPQVEKVYDLLGKLVDKGVVVTVLPNYVPLGFTQNLVNFDHANMTAEKIIMAKSYFSDYEIELLMEDFFAHYLTYSGVPSTVETMYNLLNYFERKKLIFWVAYHLIDRKRMNYASTAEMIRLAQGGDPNGGDLKNTEQTITTRIGETFIVVEKESEGGKGMDGFTSLWGDQYSYLTKMQLWIRDRFERMFNDYSLRDDTMRSSTFVVEKPWMPYTWTQNWLSHSTIDILQPDNR